MTKCYDISASVSHSKGSNINYELEHANFDAPITFSYHPTHSSGRGKDKESDKNRAHDIRGFVGKVLEEVSKNKA